MSRSSAARLCVLILVLCLPASAGAATVSLASGSVTINDAGAENNTITINYTGGAWVIHESGASPLLPGGACTGGGANVSCATVSPVQATVTDAGGDNAYTMLADYPASLT